MKRSVNGDRCLAIRAGQTTADDLEITPEHPLGRLVHSQYVAAPVEQNNRLPADLKGIERRLYTGETERACQSRRAREMGR